MEAVPKGTYRIFTRAASGMFLTGVLPSGFPFVTLGPGDDSQPQAWKIVPTNQGTYTIGQASTNLYLGYDGEPDVFERVGAHPEAREWSITGEPPYFVIIGVPGNEALTLGLSPVLIFPPMLALSPRNPMDQPWSLEPLD